MRSLFLGTAVLWLGTLTSGCLSDSKAEQGDGYKTIPYSLVSEGSQSDFQNQHHEVITNSDQFSNFLSSAPSINGEIPNPDFSSETIISVLAGFGVCTALEVSSVKDNNETVLINLVKVYTVNPGLCDPSPEAFETKHYAFISIDRTTKPVSFVYATRNDY
jgi:hypothetical protein